MAENIAIQTDAVEGEVLSTKLNPKQERFCELYSSHEEFFANGTMAYIEAYDVNTSKPNAYKVAQASASRLLSKVMILDRINELLELRGLNDVYVDKQLEFLITQNAELGTKLAAIREYNKLKSRIVEKSELNVVMPTPILGGETKKIQSDGV